MRDYEIVGPVSIKVESCQTTTKMILSPVVRGIIDLGDLKLVSKITEQLCRLFEKR